MPRVISHASISQVPGPFTAPFHRANAIKGYSGAGDKTTPGLVALLLAPEVPPEADEIAALRELADGPAADRELLPLDLG